MPSSPSVQRDSDVGESAGQEKRRGEEASEDTPYINALGEMSTGGWSHPAVVSFPRAGTATLPMCSHSSGSFHQGLGCPSASSLLFLHDFVLQPTAQLGCKVKAEGDGVYASCEGVCSH